MRLRNRITQLTEVFINWKLLPYIIVGLFTILYLILSITKHLNFLSGYDLAIADQIVWKYSQFKNPIVTVHSFFDMHALEDHIELIYILIAPVYWVANSVYTILILQTLSITISAVAVYKLTQLKKLAPFVALSIILSYLAFFGFQNAIWADVHSLVFAVGFLAWFIYFLEKKNLKLTLLFFILAIVCKEDIALLTFFISLVYFLYSRDKKVLIITLLSTVYLFYVFAIHFPLFTDQGYRYANPNGLFSDVNPYYMINTEEKQKTILYSLGWFGFLPLLSPIHLIPAAGDLGHYYILGESIVAPAQGLFLHYRSSLSILLIWPTIIVISKYRKLNSKYTAIYLILCAAFFQYYLHLPLSYLSKSWFWNTSPAVTDIRQAISNLPNSSIVSQNNITPHLTHRDEVYTLWPSTKDFKTNSPCGNQNCNWFRWGGNPKYLIVDTSEDWDARHFLTSRENFIKGIRSMEKAEIISEYFRAGNSVIYKIKLDY